MSNSNGRFASGQPAHLRYGSCEIIGIRRDPLTKAFVRCLKPLAGSPRSYRDTLERLGTAASTARRRLYQLRHRGAWPELEKTTRFHQIGYCPPVVLELDGRTGYGVCKQTAYCPWCWCRSYAAELAMRLQVLQLKRGHYRDGDKLWLIRSHLTFPQSRFSARDAVGWIRDNQKAFYNELFVKNFDFTHFRQMHGYRWLVSVEPWRSSGRDPADHWRVTHRLLVACRDNRNELPRQLRADHGLGRQSIKVSRRVTCCSLARLSISRCNRIVGEFAAFPAGIHRAPVEQAAELLCALRDVKRQKPFKCAGSGGNLRGKLQEHELELLRERYPVHGDDSQGV